jgi:Hypothetical protein (DUF2513)
VRRDIDLVREILLRLESLDAGSGAPIPLDVGEGPLEISGYTKKQIAYHLRIMADGGLISIRASRALATREFLDSAGCDGWATSF